MLFVFVRAGLDSSSRGLSGEERVPEPEVIELSARALFDMALDSLFSGYDAEVLHMLAPDSSDGRLWVDSLMATLSLEDKIGQLFIVNLSSSTSRRAKQAALKAVTQHKVGGFLVSRAMEPGDVYEMSKLLQEEAELPLFFAADYERGVGRFSNNLTEWPSNMGLGATRNPLFAAAAGRLTAIEGRAVGVNMVLAPVVDVNNNPDNPIINIRSYGEDPELVGLMAKMFVSEAQELGMLTTLKHFPGHGNTEVDTHTRMGTIYGDHNSLHEVELFPYRFVFDEPLVNPTAVMSAHLWIPAFDSDPLPATFSRNVLHNLLRDTLRFDGLIITDDVKMGALQNDYSFEERMLNPLLAGADMVLTPRDLERSIAVIREAVEGDKVSEAALNHSVRRILLAKASSGLHKQRSVTRPVLDYLLAFPRGERLAQAAANKAITLLQNDDLLPLHTDQRVTLVQMANLRNSQSIDAAMDLFAESISDSLSVVDVRISTSPTGEQIQDLEKGVESADALVVVLYLRLRAGRGEAGLYADQAEIVEQLVALDKPVALITLGNPYAIMPFSESEALLVAYEQSLASVRALSSIVLGGHHPSGKLPITVGSFAYGSGLDRIRPDRIAVDQGPLQDDLPIIRRSSIEIPPGNGSFSGNGSLFQGVR